MAAVITSLAPSSGLVGDKFDIVGTGLSNESSIETDMDPVELFLRLNDNTSDDSGNGHVTTVINSPTYATGKFGKAISLNGTSQYLKTDIDTNEFRGSGIGSNAISCWVKLNSLYGEQSIINVGHSTGSGVENLRVYVQTDGKVVCSRGFYGSDTPSTNVLTVGQWHNITVSFKNSFYGQRLWIDNVLQPQNSFSGMAPTTGYLCFGARDDDVNTVDRFLDGSIDQIRVWLTDVSGATPLSTQDVTDLYNESDANPTIDFDGETVTAESYNSTLISGVTVPNQARESHPVKVLVDSVYSNSLDYTINEPKPPQAMLKSSVDGGHTYGNELWQSMGRTGEYKTRLRWNRIGVASDWVFELKISDKVKVAITSAVADIEVIDR